VGGEMMDMNVKQKEKLVEILRIQTNLITNISVISYMMSREIRELRIRFTELEVEFEAHLEGHEKEDRGP
jgi:hypothetical protein